MNIIEIQERTQDLIQQMLVVWEKSVRETHLFLSDAEIEMIKEYVPEALTGVAHLIVAKDEEGHAVAFMGIENDVLEMLFITPGQRGKGLGKELLSLGIERYGVKQVTVNEQNPQAIGFYERMGFQVYKRTDNDEQGNPYPLLYMRLEKSGEEMSMNMWGKKVIEKAYEYANYKWTAHEKNVMHGIDENGHFVDTPNITWRGEILDCGWWKVDEVNVGIPYGWGNASTIEEFEIGIREGKYAGNVPEDTSRYGSWKTVGVDCSGLLTRCWELPKKIATRDIPEYATVLESIDEIQQGDVFAKVGSHVMFFVEFVDDEKKEVTIIDATRSTGKVSQRTENVAELFENGYEIYRKKQ